jgi:hypothetical protein
MILQIGMAQAYLYSKNISHNDVNGGNVLFLKLQDVNGYFEYIGEGGKKIYIKHYGYLFVLWDFGIATTANRRIPHYTEQWFKSGWNIYSARDTFFYDPNKQEFFIPRNFKGMPDEFGQTIMLKCSFVFELAVLLNYLISVMDQDKFDEDVIKYFQWFAINHINRDLLFNIPDKDFNRDVGIANWMFGEKHPDKNKTVESSMTSLKSIIHFMATPPNGRDRFKPQVDYINEVLPPPGAVPDEITMTVDAREYL